MRCYGEKKRYPLATLERYGDAYIRRRMSRLQLGDLRHLVFSLELLEKVTHFLS